MLKDFKDVHRAVGFAQGGRPKGDFYATPAIATTALLEKELFGPVVLEPACGDGSMVRVLVDHGHTVIARDLYDWGFGEIGIDFLTSPVQEVDAVITNPPFNRSLEFTLKALACTKERKGKVAILNRIQWLEGQKRKVMFCNNPISKVWIFSKRLPRFHRFDFKGKPSTNLIGFAWFVFDWQYEGETKLGWL